MQHGCTGTGSATEDIVRRRLHINEILALCWPSNPTRRIITRRLMVEINMSGVVISGRTVS